MEIEVSLDAIYKPSEDVVVREIEGKIIIIPITFGVEDLEDEIFTLNKTGRAIWEKVDGKRDTKGLIKELTSEFKTSAQKIEKDVLGLLKELLKRRMLVEVK